MSIILSKIVSIVLAPFLFVSGLFGNNEIANFGASLPQGVAVFETSLLSAITSSATTMTLTANSVRGGSTLSGYNCFTIDEGKAEREDVCGTVSGTTVSSLTRGVDPLTATTTNATLQFAHRRGAQVKVTDFPIIQIMRHQLNGSDTFVNPLVYDSAVAIATSSNQIPRASWVDSQFVDGSTNETINGLKTFSTLPQSSVVPSSGDDLSNKTYVDAGVAAGCSYAGASTKGCVKMATIPQLEAGTASIGVGETLAIGPNTFFNSIFASSTAYSTTSLQNLASSTLSTIPNTDTVRIIAHASTTGGTANFYVNFNGDNTKKYYSGWSESGGTLSTSDSNNAQLSSNAARSFSIDMTISNVTNRFKTATYTMTLYDVNSNVENVIHGGLTYKSFSKISSVTFSGSAAANTLLGTSTLIRAIGE